MNDPQIIKAIKNSDKAAINYVINKYSRLMWSIAATILKNVGTTEDIEECVADVFVYLWENPSKYHSARGKLKSWLSIVARSRAIDKYRQLSRQITIPMDDKLLTDTLDITNNLLSQETKYTLNAAVKSLAELDREILVRRYYYEQKPGEIAFALGIPVKQVENHLYRTKLKLRELLAN